MTPHVSVVIPTYNYGSYVEEALDSAVRQRVQPWEVIVVDDGSTDDTRQRLAHRGDIRYIYQKNAGLSAARNAGIAAATGEWIALLDADDVWHSEKLAVQLRALLSYPTAGFIGSPPAPGPMPEQLPATGELRRLGVRDFLQRAPIGPSGALFRKDMALRVGGFRERLRAVEDRDMWLRLACISDCVLVPSPCWFYRPHSAQMSKQADRMWTNYKSVLAEFFKEHPRYLHLSPLGFAYMCLDGAWSYWQQGAAGRALRLVLASLAMYPLPFTGGVERFVRLRLLRKILVARSALLS